MVAVDNSHITVITGGGSGLGRAAALRLVSRGDQVCICDLKADSVKATAELIESAGGKAFTGVVDVREQAQVDGWIAEVIGQFGRIDGLFSNAGV
ncbi:MAG: SDR family NAD(P)-dependent oxidoreductase, partial [Deltaproteobacteria bacterium]|nr:SDR family NAD(P)-dependent oxidoreductase [Deltaproteobacteria bacterium]